MLTRYVSKLLHAANQDFCPSLNRYVYWLKRPIGWVVLGFLFSLMAGLLVSAQGYYLAAAFFATLVLGLVWPWLSMKGLSCEILIPTKRAREQQPIQIMVRVRNYWPLPVLGLIVRGDFLQDIVAGEDLAFSLKRLPAWSESEFSFPITPQRRGRLPSGNVQIGNGFPFGLIEVARPVAIPANCPVWPAALTLGEEIKPSTSLSLSVLGELSDRSGNSGETIGIRPYRQGDKMRSIHWAQTLRSRGLMVREHQSICAASAIVVLDLLPNHHSGTETKNSYEQAIRIASGICQELNNWHGEVRLECIGLADTPVSSDNRSGIETLMDFLTDLPKLKEVSSECRQWSESGSTRQFQTHSSRVFVIGTKRTPWTQFSGINVRPVVIDLADYAENVDPADESFELPLLPMVSAIEANSPIHLSGDGVLSDVGASYAAS